MDERGIETTRWSQITARARHLTHSAQRFVHDRPLQAIALTIGMGFVVGKIFAGRGED
jgi:ElaB/YqjD/DUF883 family membrane-anchored ribosome-binding protein